MIFAPHKLYKQIVSPVQNDEYGQPIFDSEESWEEVCVCRCDDKNTDWYVSENGSTYVTKHHVVCNGKVDLHEGDYIRCMDGDKLRAEGEVYMVKRSNYFGYTEVYL